MVRVLSVAVPPKVPLRVTLPLDTRVLTPVLVKVPVELKLVQDIEPELKIVPVEVTPAAFKLPLEAMVSVPVPFIDVAPATVSVLLPSERLPSEITSASTVKLPPNVIAALALLIVTVPAAVPTGIFVRVTVKLPKVAVSPAPLGNPESAVQLIGSFQLVPSPFPSHV